MNSILYSDFGSKFGFYGGPWQKCDFNDVNATFNALVGLSWVPIIGGFVSGITRIALLAIEYNADGNSDYGIRSYLKEKHVKEHLGRAVIDLIPGSCLILIPVDIAFSIGRCFCQDTSHITLI